MDDEEPVVEIKLEPYIQWLPESPGRCVICDLTKVGSGLVGFRRDDPPGPVCDPCLIQLQPRLGMALLFLNICRELADDWPDQPEDQDRRSEVLMAVARLYHAQESREWPMRPLRILKLMEEHGGPLAEIPLDAWVRSLEPRALTG